MKNIYEYIRIFTVLVLQKNCYLSLNRVFFKALFTTFNSKRILQKQFPQTSHAFISALLKEEKPKATKINKIRSLKTHYRNVQSFN